MLETLKAYRRRWSQKKWAITIGSLLSLAAAAMASMIAIRNEQHGVRDYFHVILATVLVTVSLKYAIDRLTLD